MITSNLEEIALSPLKRLLLFCGFALATFMVVLDFSIANVSIPYIAGDLGISASEGTYVITSFAIGNAIGLALCGWLSKKYSHVYLFLGSVITFVFFSWCCGASQSLEQLVISRFLQGLTAGPLVPLSQALVLITSHASKRNISLAIWGSIIMVAPVLGPILGGWISEDYKWPWIFYINIPFGILTVAIIYTLLRDYHSRTEKAPTNWMGILLLVLAVTSLQIVLDKGEQWDWIHSDKIRILSIVSIISFTFLFIWEFYHPSPILELRLFKLKSFALTILCLVFSYAIYFGSLVLTPLWLQLYMGYTAIWAGLAVAPFGIAPALLSIVVVRLMPRLGAIRLLMICFALFAFSCFFTAYFNTSVTVGRVGFGRFLFGVGMVFYITPLLSLITTEVEQSRIPSATSMFHFIRSLVGGFGTSLFSTLWQRRMIFHHEVMGSQLTPYNPITSVTTSTLEKLGLSGIQSKQALNQITDKQAALLGINDCFYLMGWIFIGLIFLVSIGLFFEKRSTGSSSVSSALSD